MGGCEVRGYLSGDSAIGASLSRLFFDVFVSSDAGKLTCESFR